VADTKLILGGITFQGFEIPERIKLGGKHHINKHVLIGGQRVLDRMGPDPDDIRWSGRFRGNNALSRALSVDALRQSGAQVALTCHGLHYQVVVASFDFNPEKRYEIPYDISCMVSQVSGAGAGGIFSSVTSLVSGDLGALVSLGGVL
jgi:hypothetical protein